MYTYDKSCRVRVGTISCKWLAACLARLLECKGAAQ